MKILYILIKIDQQVINFYIINKHLLVLIIYKLINIKFNNK